MAFLDGMGLQVFWGKVKAMITSHTNNKSNPHAVTLTQIGAAASNHMHSASQVTGLPTSLPANGGNADTAQRLTTFKDNYKDGASLPSTYPQGMSLFFSNNPSNKYKNLSYCTVETHKGYSNMACTQFLYPYDQGTSAPIYYRHSTYGYDTWGEWKTLVTSDLCTATIGTTWSGTTAPYTQVIPVTGIVAADNPMVDVVLSDTITTALAQEKAWNCVSRIVTGENKVTVYCNKKKPTTAIPIQLKVVR